MSLEHIARLACRLLPGRAFTARRRLVELFQSDAVLAPGVRPPFELPLRIAVFGPRWAKPVLRAAKGYSKDTFVINQTEVVEDLCSDPPAHILVIDTDDLAVVQSGYLRSAVSSDGLPALVIATGSPWAALGTVARLPWGVAFLITPRANFRRFFARLIDSIADDRPLDRAVLRAARSVLHKRGATILFTDRYVNQALRMADALEMLQQEFELRGLSAPELVPKLQVLAAAKHNMAGSYSHASWAPSADIVIMHAVFRQGRKRALDPGTTLQAGQHYFVQVHVGNPLPSSIVRMGSPEIGSPETGVRVGPSEAQLLEVVIQPKDFRLRSSNRRFLFLQPYGASTRVRFGLTAPEKTGQAKMRIAVFCGNQMLQAFDIQAHVADREYTSDAPSAGATAEVEFSQVEDLAKLNLPSRILTISVNRENSSHTLLVKGVDNASGVDLSDSTVRKHLREYRRILRKATFDKDGKARFPSSPADQPNHDSRKFIYSLADLGRKMYKALYDPDDTERVAVFEKIRASQNEVISIVRHDFGFAWPWPILYDFPLPEDIFPFTPDVCYGYTADGLPCGHNGEKRICCVRGFWGYRLQIEELHGGRIKRSRTDKVDGFPKRLLGYVGSTGTEYEKKMKTALAALGDELQPVGFLDTLWDPNRRPALVLILGHMEIADKQQEPTGPRIVLATDPTDPDHRATHWLRDGEVMDKVLESTWPQPQSIVMLLSCESAGTSPATLSNLVLSLLKAHAAAVIGTECEAFTQLLARFGQELAESMICDHQSLGEAITSTRRRLLHQGIPLAFVINSMGVADLKINIPKEETT